MPTFSQAINDVEQLSIESIGCAFLFRPHYDVTMVEFTHSVFIFPVFLYSSHLFHKCKNIKKYFEVFFSCGSKEVQLPAVVLTKIAKKNLKERYRGLGFVFVFVFRGRGGEEGGDGNCSSMVVNQIA